MTIEIEKFHFKTIIGILEHERITPQTVEITLKASYDYKKEFIDYVQICNLIQATMQKEKFFLLEDALEALHKKIFQTFPQITWLYLKIAKPSILKNAIVALSCSWENPYQES